MRIIAGTYGGRQIRTTHGPGYRPATGRVRESLFSMLSARGLDWSALRVADIFAGSGALGLETLSRGAAHVFFVEKAPTAAALIRANLQTLDVSSQRYTVLKADALRCLTTISASPFDLVFIDPPYGQGLCLPTIQTLLSHDLLTPGGLLCAEVEAGLIFSEPPHEQLIALRDKLYGQTRICLWTRKENASPCIPAASTPSPTAI